MILPYSAGIEISKVWNYLQNFNEVEMSDQIHQTKGIFGSNKQ